MYSLVHCVQRRECMKEKKNTFFKLSEIKDWNECCVPSLFLTASETGYSLILPLTALLTRFSSETSNVL